MFENSYFHIAQFLNKVPDPFLLVQIVGVLNALWKTQIVL